MDSLTVALASLGGVVLAGVIAHGAWQARRAGPKQAERPARGAERHGPGARPTSPVSRAEEADLAADDPAGLRRGGCRSARRCSSMP